jgi:hypothetical protein
MGDSKHFAKLKSGVKIWNEWRNDNSGELPDLTGADLRNFDLRKVNLKGAKLSDANLGGTSGMEANLIDADLSRANLVQANFSGANLTHANLREAKLVSVNLSEALLNRAILIDADLSEANLRDANFGRADLRGANITAVDFSGATLLHTDLSATNLSGSLFIATWIGNTHFGATNLSEAIGLETVQHFGPSSIGLETIYKAQGRIPEVFLRGCGFSDLQIETLRLSLPGLDSEQVTDIAYKIHQLYLGNGILYYSCFISYNNKDTEFAGRLHDDLQNHGVRCWFAPEDLKIGDQIRPRIDQEIRLRDKLLVILSENSVTSEWVGDEVEAALEEESKSNRLVLFPIRLDDAVMNTRDDWAAKIQRRRHIGDFSNWKDKYSYQKAFERLLRDLKATGV